MEFDDNDKPTFGKISIYETEIYNGQIVGDIHDYFIEYIETGKIAQRPIIF